MTMPVASPRPRDGDYVEREPGTEVVRVSGGYRGGLRDGVWRRFAPDGQVLLEESWERGLRHGPYQEWTPEGVRVRVGRYGRGVRVGEWTTWHANGVLAETVEYDERGRRQGRYVRYFDDGTEAQRGTWLDDEQHGAWTTWRTGQWARTKENFHRRQQHGEQTCWYANGQLGERVVYRNWDKHGVEERFDERGRPAFRGEWRGGHPVGEHVTWDRDGVESREAFVEGLPQALIDDEALHKRVVRKLARPMDHYQAIGVITDAVGYTRRFAYVAYLWRSGRLDIPAVRPLWELVDPGLLDGTRLVAFLRAIEYRPHDASYGAILPGWSFELDRIVMGVYQRDPGPVDEARESLPEWVRRGVALVRGRFGRDVGEELHGRVADLARACLTGVPDVWWPEGDGHLARRYLDREPEQFDELRALFASRKQWGAALRREALREGHDDFFLRHMRDAVATGTPEEVAALLDQARSSSAEEVHRALTEWRDDEPATTARIALAVTGEWPRRYAVVTAVHQHQRAGQRPPDSLLDALALDNASTNVPRAQVPGLLSPDEKFLHPAMSVAYRDMSVLGALPAGRLSHEVMRSLPVADARRVIERHIDLEYGCYVAAEYLYLVDDPQVWDRFLSRYGVDSGLGGGVGYGVGSIGLDVVPLLLARLDSAQRITYPLPILTALARGILDTGNFPEEYDDLVTFQMDEYRWTGVGYLVERILWELPVRRAEPILLRGLGSSSAWEFAWAFGLIGCHPTETVLRAAFTGLLEREATLDSGQRDAVARGLRSLDNAADWVRWIRGNGGGAGLTEVFQTAIGAEEVARIDAELAATGVQAARPLDDIDRICLAARRLGGTERIYLLRRLNDGVGEDHDGDGDLNVIGGDAPGVDAARWPRGGDDEPMTHLFTMDVDTMPELRRLVGEQVRAVSVFCLHPDDNEAWVPDNGATAVLCTTAEELAERAAPPDDYEPTTRRRFAAVPVDVPPSVWWTGEDEDDFEDHDEDEDGEDDGQEEDGGAGMPSEELTTLHKMIYVAHGRVLGEPIWLQSDEEGDGSFLMQFDEGFCSMNLGDCGVMYVFSGDAFWQCH